jgi:hypothetical protein
LGRTRTDSIWKCRWYKNWKTLSVIDQDLRGAGSELGSIFPLLFFLVNENDYAQNNVAGAGEFTFGISVVMVTIRVATILG